VQKEHLWKTSTKMKGVIVINKIKVVPNEELWNELGRRMENVYEKNELNQLVSKLDTMIHKMEFIAEEYNKEWLTMKEAMQYLDFKPNTFSEWRAKGLQVAVVGRKLYVSKTEINRFLQENQL